MDRDGYGQYRAMDSDIDRRMSIAETKRQIKYNQGLVHVINWIGESGIPPYGWEERANIIKEIHCVTKQKTLTCSLYKKGIWYFLESGSGRRESKLDLKDIKQAEFRNGVLEKVSTEGF